MRLYKKSTNESLSVTLRPFRPEDAPQLIACIRDAYGDSYVKPFLYTEEGIFRYVQSGKMSFSVAETEDGQIAGITAYERSEHFPGMAEIACQVIRRSCSGYGLALPLALHTMEMAETLPLTAQYSKALGCHLISQKTLKGMGFTGCGFLLNVFDKEKFLHRFENGNYAKIPQSVAIKRQDKEDAGQVWLPEELVPLAAGVYEGQGLSWNCRPQASWLTGPDLWEEEDDRFHATLALWARTCGEGFPDRLAAYVDAVANRPGQTVNLYLNLSRPGSGAAYEAARRQGFFFTGFLPCCGDGEYMILHHPLQVPVLLDDIPFIPEYEPFMAQIRRSL